MTTADYFGYAALALFALGGWVIAIMVMIDPPALFLRFLAPLMMGGLTCAFIAMGLEAT